MFDAMTDTMPAASDRDVHDAVLSTVGLDDLRVLYQALGYRVETLGEGGGSFLRSATNGVAFDIRPGNGLANVGDRFVDFALLVLFAVQGTLPPELMNSWNRTRRFGRLFLDQTTPGQDFLVFALDISVVGGVTPTQLRAQIELGDSLMQQLVPWLREELAKLAPSVAAANQPAA
jgi:hypothetical protein